MHRKKGMMFHRWSTPRLFEIRGSALLEFASDTRCSPTKVYDISGAVLAYKKSTSQLHAVSVTLGAKQYRRTDLFLAAESSEALTSFLEELALVARAFPLTTRLQPVATIGTGSWGRVMMFQDIGKTPTQMYAIKEVALLSSGNLSHLTNERIVMSSVPANRFIVNLLFAARRPGFLYYGLELAPGGDLYSLIRGRKRAFETDAARVYAAEILLALRHLHEHNVLYRDLKPENILLTDTGHVKLGDLGLAKRVMPNEHTYTLCGTDPYVSPEMLRREGYRTAVDFWQYGCVLYELFTAKSPFYSARRQEINGKILSGKFKPLEDATAAAMPLISALLQQNQAERLTSWELVQRDPWFESINWELAEAGHLEPPHRRVEWPSEAYTPSHDALPQKLPSDNIESVHSVEAMLPESSLTHSATLSTSSSALSLVDLDDHVIWNRESVALVMENFDPDVSFDRAGFSSPSAENLLAEQKWGPCLKGFTWMRDPGSL
jgi:serine/threonine protein kinase